MTSCIGHNNTKLRYKAHPGHADRDESHSIRYTNSDAITISSY